MMHNMTLVVLQSWYTYVREREREREREHDHWSIHDCGVAKVA